MHEALIRLHLADILAQKLKAVTKLDALVADEVGEDEGGTSTLTLDGVDKDLAAAIQCLVDESIRYAEEFLGVLLGLIV